MAARDEAAGAAPPHGRPSAQPGRAPPAPRAHADPVATGGAAGLRMPGSAAPAEGSLAPAAMGALRDVRQGPRTRSAAAASRKLLQAAPGASAAGQRPWSARAFPVKTPRACTPRTPAASSPVSRPTVHAGAALAAAPGGAAGVHAAPMAAASDDAAGVPARAPLGSLPQSAAAVPGPQAIGEAAAGAALGRGADSCVDLPGAKRRTASARKLSAPSAKERQVGVRKPVSPTKGAGAAARRGGAGDLGVAAPRAQQRLVVRVQRVPAVAAGGKALLGGEGLPARDGWGLGSATGAR